MAARPLQMAKRALVTILIALAQQYSVRLALLESPICHAFERKSESEGCKASRDATSFCSWSGCPFWVQKMVPFSVSAIGSRPVASRLLRRFFLDMQGCRQVSGCTRCNSGGIV